MTDTLISLISIMIGIIGANFTGLLFKRYSFGLIGNTIAGVFGSILLMKSLGRLGFDPISIMQSGNTDLPLFLLNCLVSFGGGALAIIFLKKLKTAMNSKNSIQNNMIKIFKITSFLEGVSYILLLFVGVPLKYFGDNDVLVKSLGMPHGMLFLAYILLALWIRSKMNWNATDTFIVLIASLLPFGTFYINKKYVDKKGV
jgi:integral membrane protein